MSTIDGRGRLMGRFNLIDVAVALLVAAVIPTAFVAYRVLRTPLPVMVAVTPATVSPNGPLEIRVTGAYFRPFLRAYVSRTGVQLQSDDLPQDQRARYLIQTTSAIELKLPPDMRPGSYDLYLYDEGRALAHLTPAFTLAAPGVRAADPAAGPTATLEMRVRFLVDPEILPSVHVGDADLNQPENGEPATVAATLVSWRRLPEPAGASPRLSDGAALPVADTLPVMEAVVRLGAVMRNTVWEYAGPQPLRAGEPFPFMTSSYIIRGIIMSVAETPHGANRAADRQ